MIPSQSIRFIPIEWENETPAPPLPELPLTVDISLRAFSAGVGDGINGMIREGMEQYGALQKGEMSGGEYAKRLMLRGSREAVRGGVRTAAALTLHEGARRLILSRWGQRGLLRATRFNTLISLAYGVVDQGMHTFQWANGQMDTRQYKVKTTENGGITLGAISGAAAGSVIGSVVPGLGTVAGGVLGMVMSMLGAMSGAEVGKSLGEKWFPEAPKTDKTEDETSA